MSVPISRSAVADLYFMEHRAKVLDIAAFLDRYDRAKTADDESEADDFRVKALRSSIAILLDGRPERARRIQQHLSDLSTEPIDKAPMQGALGAPLPDISDRP